MISVKCPTCGLVDWNVGDCKRCGTSLLGLGAEEGDDHLGEARAVRRARRVMFVCALAVLGLTAFGALYVARKPSKPQWFRSLYRDAPTVSEIFAHNLKVTGGAERVARLRSFRAEGRLALNGGAAATAAAAADGHVTFVMHVKMPNKVESEVEIGPPGETASGVESPQPSPASYLEPAAPQVRVNLRRGFDGAKGWEYVERTVLNDGSTVPVKQYSSRALDADELWRMKRYSQAAGLVRAADEYTSLRLEGRVPVNWVVGGTLNFNGRELTDTTLRGHEAYVVSGVNKEGRGETFYFDTETGLLLRVDFEAEGAAGEAAKVECHFGDYKEVGGLKLPHRLFFKRGEESVTMTFEKYLPNEPIPDSTFDPPEPTE
jgi:hypothetical protein